MLQTSDLNWANSFNWASTEYPKTY